MAYPERFILRFLHDDRACELESQTGRLVNHLGLSPVGTYETKLAT
jgi:hypothetical protein